MALHSALTGGERVADATDGDMDSTWSKLRQRKVVQWGIAYAAGAWGLLQVLQFLADTYDWPSQILRLVTLVFALGLPIALILAWFHGDRGHQRPVRAEIAIIALLLLVGGSGLWVYQRSIGSTAESTATSAPTPATAPSERKASASVAVLPFTNLSADPTNAYLADGIAETLITMLAQVPKLMVIGKVSSFSYKGQDVDPRTIGQQLGVGALLEGSVQRVGDRLRVAVQLVSTGDGGHLWAETYDRPTTDVFAVQDEIATRVTEALSVALAGHSGPGSIGTTNVAAYDAYLKGKQLVDRHETKALEEGVALLEKAVAADPEFARAWIELSGAYAESAQNVGSMTIGRMPPDQAFALSERAARSAVAAAPDSGHAQASLGLALLRQGHKDYARHYERAIELSPGDPEVIRAHAFYLRITDRTQEALQEFEPLLALEPRDAGLRISYAGILDTDGDLKGALRQYREAIWLEPERVLPYHWAGAITFGTIGKADLGLRLLRHASRLDPNSPDIAAALAGGYWFFGETELERQALETLRKLGATWELQAYDAAIASMDGRPDDARSLLLQRLKDEPNDAYATRMLARLRGSSDEYRYALQQAKQLRASDPDEPRSSDLVDALVCLNAWLGNLDEANAYLERWEPIWRTRHAFGFMSEGARYDQLARSLACVGRNEDTLDELEALVKEGYNMFWQSMEVDPAYDAIRSDPRFKAVSDKLKAADAAARARFRARPDLNDADIESLGM